MDPAAAQPLTAIDAPAGVADWSRPLLEEQLVMLGQLAQMGMSVARAIERQAVAAAEAVQPAAPVAASDPAADPAPIAPPIPPPTPIVVEGDLALAFARVSRAVRMTLALQAQVIEAMRAHQTHGAVIDGGAAMERRGRVGRIVGRIAAAELRAQEAGAAEPAHDGADETHDIADADEADDGLETIAQAATRIAREAVERLEDEDLYGDVLRLPFSEAVARVCADLGLSPDWPRLAREAWAQAELAAGGPALGSPLADLAAETPPHLSPPPFPPPAAPPAAVARAPLIEPAVVGSG